MTYLQEQRQLDMSAIASFEARQDNRDERRVARLAADGFTRALCPRCLAKRDLSYVGWECNEFDANTDDQMCGGRFQAVR